MSAHAGIFNKANRHADLAALEAILDAGNAPYGPDRASRHVDARVTMLHWAQWFDTLSRREIQPRHLDSGATITFDGRLDNRSDLMLQLRTSLPDGSRSSDVEIVAAVYERYGLDAFALLEGDWTVVVYERTTQTLMLARDYMGVRPLYYAVDGDTVLWSTNFAPLVHGLRTRTLDDDYLISGLMFQPRDDRTVYRDIRQVLPATWLRFDAEGRTTTSRYWDPSNVARIRYRDAREYAVGLRTLFREAVAVRLRSDSPVGVKLSGGYDSSAVTCMASCLVSERAVEAPAICPVTYINVRSPESNEMVYVAAVESAYNLRTTIIRNGEDDNGWSRANELDPLRPTEQSSRLERALEPLGVKVVLSGELGDLVMGKGRANCVSILEPLFRGELGEFWRLVTRWAEVRKVPLAAALGQVFEPFVPSWMVDIRWARHQRRELQKAYRSKATTWADLYGLLPERLEGCSFTRPKWRETHRAPYSKRWMATRLLEIAASSGLVSPESSAVLRSTHPYSHRSLVQFILGIPQSAVWTPDQQRALMKQALGCILPPAVLRRNSKGDVAPNTTRQTRTLVSALGSDAGDWELVKRGVVQPALLRHRLTEVLGGRVASTRYIGRLCEIESWLRGRGAELPEYMPHARVTVPPPDQKIDRALVGAKGL